MPRSGREKFDRPFDAGNANVGALAERHVLLAEKLDQKLLLVWDAVAKEVPGGRRIHEHAHAKNARIYGGWLPTHGGVL